MASATQTNHHIVIVGGGFGGLYAAQSMRHCHAAITLLDRRNFHLFQPLLYQVATGGLSPANIAAPLRSVLKKQLNTRVLLGDVVDFDVAGRRVILADGTLSYDSLIIATGSSHSYFGHPEWEALAPGLKSVEDATEIRRRVFLAYEAAEREPDPAAREPWMTFVVVGGGPTGVELAGALGELAHNTLWRDFRVIDTRKSRVILVEGSPRVLHTYREKLSKKAVHSLNRLGVEVQEGTIVTAIDSQRVVVRRGDKTETIEARTTLWAAGVQASSLGHKLAAQTGVPLDHAGRVLVAPDMSVPGHPEIFVIGDLANFSHQTGQPLPGVAPVAMQQGRYVARKLDAQLRGQPDGGRPFHYHDKGSLATIGRAAAVADFGWITISGLLAWLTWLFIHVLFLIQFQNRILVMVQWAANYITRGRSARLITGEHLEPPDLAGFDQEGEKAVSS